MIDKEKEIEGPHGCGVYGHNHYGLPRAEVEFALDINEARTTNLTKQVQSLYDDGLVDARTRDICILLINALHGTIEGHIEEILKQGDIVNNLVRNNES
jgi:hypothetical protein